jgi:hypothetical protein
MRTRRPFCQVLAGIVFVTELASVAGRAEAGSPIAPSETASRRADRLFDESKPLLEAGRYAEACPKLSESESLDPATGTLLALALCHEGEGKTASAYTELGRVAADARKEGRADRVKLANQHLTKLLPLLSRITLTVPEDLSSVPGFAIECDGRAVPTAEWNQATPADPGEHVVGVSAPGRVAWHTTFVLPKQETKTLAIPPLEEAPSERAIAPTASESRSRRQAGFLTLAGGGVALAVGVVVGIDALAQQAEVKTLCPEFPKCAAGSPGAEKSQAVQTEAWATDIALGLGVVAAGVGAYLVLTAPRSSSQGLRIVPQLAWGHAGVSLSTDW